MNTDKKRIVELEQALGEMIQAIQPFYPLLARKYDKILHPPILAVPSPIGPDDRTIKYDRILRLQEEAIRLQDEVSHASTMITSDDLPNVTAWKMRKDELSEELSAVLNELETLNRPPTEETPTNRHFRRNEVSTQEQ